MSWLTQGWPIAASAGVSRPRRQASPSRGGVTGEVDRAAVLAPRPARVGPAEVLQRRRRSARAPRRAAPRSVSRAAYCSLSQLSGVAPGTSTVELVQHQSNHHCRVPEPLVRGVQREPGPGLRLVAEVERVAVRREALARLDQRRARARAATCASARSRPESPACTFSTTASRWRRAQAKNAPGRGRGGGSTPSRPSGRAPSSRCRRSARRAGRRAAANAGSSSCSYVRAGSAS